MTGVLAVGDDPPAALPAATFAVGMPVTRHVGLLESHSTTQRASPSTRCLPRRSVVGRQSLVVCRLPDLDQRPTTSDRDHDQTIHPCISPLPTEGSSARRQHMKRAAVIAAVLLGASNAGAQCLGDFNDNGTVEINELIVSVNNALNGCAVSPTPTAPPGGACPIDLSDDNTPEDTTTCFYIGRWNQSCGAADQEALWISDGIEDDGEDDIVIVELLGFDPGYLFLAADITSPTAGELFAWFEVLEPAARRSARHGRESDLGGVGRHAGDRARRGAVPHQRLRLRALPGDAHRCGDADAASAAPHWRRSRPRFWSACARAAPHSARGSISNANRRGCTRRDGDIGGPRRGREIRVD